MNLRKLNLGLVALLLGFGLVVTQSAFKSRTMIEYGKHQTGSGIDWVRLDVLTYVPPINDPEDGEYTCLANPTEYCNAFFDENVTPNSSTPDPENGTLGEFKPYSP